MSRKVKKLVVSPDTNIIWFAKVNEESHRMSHYRVDVTESALKAVVDHLANKKEYKDVRCSGYVYSKAMEDGKIALALYDVDKFTVVKSEELQKLVDEFNTCHSLLEQVGITPETLAAQAQQQVPVEINEVQDNTKQETITDVVEIVENNTENNQEESEN